MNVSAYRMGHDKRSAPIAPGQVSSALFGETPNLWNFYRKGWFD